MPFFAKPIASFNLEHWAYDEVQKVSDWMLGPPLIAPAIKFAADSHDGVLRLELSFVAHMAVLAKALGACEALLRSISAVGLPMKDRRIRLDAVAVLKAMRSALAALKTFVALGNIAKIAAPATDRFHYEGLDPPFMDYQILSDSLCANGDRLMNAFRVSWTHDLQQLEDGMNAACPDWEAGKENLLREPGIIKLLCDNVGTHYSSIGPLANELREQLKLVRALQSDTHGFILEPTFLARLTKLPSFGVETVAYTFVAWQIVNEFPQIESLPLKKRKLTI
jgi:hypothetical protein